MCSEGVIIQHPMRMCPTKNYVTFRNVTQNYYATFLFIFCCQLAFSQTNYLKLPKSNPRIINGQSNLVIENLAFTNLTGNDLTILNSSNIIVRNCYFGVSKGIGVELENANNITIENCFFANNRSGVYATSCSGIKVINNQFINAQGPFPRGQFVQFNTVTGAGNAVSGNRGECFRGESYAEDLVNMYRSNGTAQSPVSVKDNLFRGGGPSPSGGGLMSGDFDGGYVIVENNVLVFPGNYGIGIAGGNNITLKNNTVYSDRKPWTNVGIYVWAQQGASCSNITVTGNKSTWTHKDGFNNPFWDGGNCGTITWSGYNTNGQTLASMNFPDQLITCVTEDELWQVRDQSREFVVDYTVREMPPWLPRPAANAGSDKTVTTTEATLTGSGGNRYRWVQVSGPNNATLTNATSSNATASGLVNGTYNFRLEAYDNEGAADADWVVLTVTNSQPTPNQAPTSNAGNNIILTLPANTTTLTGNGTDTDGTIASYAWSRVSGPATFTLGSANAATTALSNLVQGTYVFRLTVTDNNGATDTDDMTVTVNAAPVINQAPTANAGNNIILTLPANTTTLTGSGTDADGTIASYAWSRVSGPATFTLGSANAATTALSNLGQGTYVFRLTVTDNDGATNTDDMTVTVNAAPAINQAPTANAGNNIILTLPANTTTLTGSGTDADGTITSYAWSRVSGPATFTLGSANAATTATSNLVQGTYVFRLTVTDNNGATDTDDMTVTVNAAPVINQAPIANAGASQLVTLSSNEATLNGALSRDPDGVIKSYKWEQISGPASAIIASSSSVTTKISGFMTGDYVFQITVKDNLNAIAKDTVTIAVVNNFRSYPGDLMLYPNPASDKINLNLYNEKYSKAQINVYDMTGSKVFPAIELNSSQNRFTKAIDLSQFKAGMYLIEIIMDNKEKVTAKFIKQ